MMVKRKPGIRCFFSDPALVKLRQEDLSLRSVWVTLQNPMKEREEEGRTEVGKEGETQAGTQACRVWRGRGVTGKIW